jgi:hypothetical protein
MWSRWQQETFIRVTAAWEVEDRDRFAAYRQRLAMEVGA